MRTDPSSLRLALTSALRQLSEAVPGERGGGLRAARIVLPCEGYDPYTWLDAQPHDCRVLWDGRDEPAVAAGVGSAYTLHASEPVDAGTVFSACRTLVAQLDGGRMYGGFAFRNIRAEPGPWQPFGTAWFVLPRFELLAMPEGGRLVCNVVWERGAPDVEAAVTDFDALHWVADSPCILPAIESRTDTPDEAAWTEMVRRALTLIRREALEKIVLARKARYRFRARVTATRLLRRLRPVTGSCYHFCLQPGPGSAFMGTTPERLFRRHGRTVESEVLAGTRARVPDAQEDARLGRELLESAKDQREHDIVRKSLRQRLHLLCDALDVDDEAHLLQLERKQHLASGVRGALRAGVADAAVLTALHPTPAVGGYPTDVALAEIERLEPFRRGWYAAPVGWIAAEACEFAVAIRSGLVTGRDVLVYSGAGIVAGSEPHAEWLEIENKISDFVKVTS